MSIPAIDLMTALRSGHSTSPRLTWYGPDAERVELSGRVLDNWVAKTSNLLQDELDAEPGMRLRLDLPAHWKSMIWALAALAARAWRWSWTAATRTCWSRPPSRGKPEDGFDAVIAVPLPALAMRWPGELPAGVVDYARRGPLARRRLHGPQRSGSGIRRVHRRSGGQPLRHADLLDGFAAGHDAGVRLLVRAADGLEAALANVAGRVDRTTVQWCWSTPTWS